MSEQIIQDAITWLEKNKDLVSNLVAMVAVFISLWSLRKSGKAHKEQLKLEKITAELSQQQLEQTKRINNATPALFLIELAGHLAVLARTLDYINPTWMHRYHKGIFNNKEISHSNLHVICYDSYIKDIQDLNTRILLDNYYKEVLVFNGNGVELLGNQIRNELTVNYFVRGAAKLILSALELVEDLKGMMDQEVLKDDQIRYSIENIEAQKQYYITICNASYLDSSSLSQLCKNIRNNELTEDIENKYPILGYIKGLHQASAAAL